MIAVCPVCPPVIHKYVYVVPPAGFTEAVPVLPEHEADVDEVVAVMEPPEATATVVVVVHEPLLTVTV